MSQENSLCISRVQFKSQEYSLCPQSAVYVLRVQFMFPEYSLCSQSTVYVPRVEFMSQEYSLCPKVLFKSQVQSLCLWSTFTPPE